MKTTNQKLGMKLAGVLVAAAALNSGISAGAADWPAYRGPAQDGIAAESFRYTGPPTTVWDAKVNNGFSSFSVADNKAFTLELGPNKTEVCRAFDARTGESLWSTTLGSSQYDGGGNAGSQDNKGGDGPRSTPSFHKGAVITLSAHLQLTRLNPANGDKIWEVDLVDKYSAELPRWQNAASPLIVDDRIYVSAGGEDQSLLCFNASTGELIWKKGTEAMTHASPIAAEIHGVKQVIFFVRDGLVSVHPATGEQLWKQDFPFNVSTAASPVVYEDIVYCSAGYGVGAAAYKVSHKAGEWSLDRMWRKRNRLMNHWSTPVAKDGYLYGMFSFKKYGTGPVMCVRLSDGEEMWSEDGFGPGNIILAGENLIALGDAGQVAVIKATPDDYQEIYNKDVLDGKCWSTPALSNGQVFVRSTIEAKCLNFGSQSVSFNSGN